ncbi:LuxR C-terminal-related transcriptional regulator [Legionella cardiaca]|uniref:LuxR C-terminal-related transcriptional regulator n=1 Tax=Legionella cardiaca TaxID=1071983 RepID=A0ABY8ARH2_9GAMM|nr:LuxR C-terminal-related transcriptional regulator [Legionella cardiaca]WED43279.1 LuxR C-terminal-related transcriptional regulator [Legionella cardiaca]
MPIKIDSEHPIFTLKDKVQEASSFLLETFGFNYFQYLRCYADGSINCLTNNPGLFEHTKDYDDQPIVFSSFEDEHESIPFYWFLWDEALPPTAPLQLAREKFNFHNGLTLVRRTKNYYDMIAVTLPYEHPNPGSFYLNKIKIIEQFIYDFDRKNKDLLHIMDKSAIALPKAYRDVNYQDMCLSQGKIKVRGKTGMTYLTTQELACLKFFLQGFSYKQIAGMLEISPRTVETYLIRVKQRTGYASFFELERMIHW